MLENDNTGGKRSNSLTLLVALRRSIEAISLIISFWNQTENIKNCSHKHFQQSTKTPSALLLFLTERINMCSRSFGNISTIMTQQDVFMFFPCLYRFVSTDIQNMCWFNSPAVRALLYDTSLFGDWTPCIGCPLPLILRMG